MSGPILEVKGLVAGYGKKRAVHGVDLTLNKGETLLVLGHNGAGKTTLMQSVFGLNPPMAGQVFYEGRDVTARNPALNVADGLAFVPQGHAIFSSLTVRDNLELGAFVETDRARIQKHLDDVFSMFPILKEREKQIAGTFSGGQKQMLAIGMALMHGPRVLILDEPSIGLAPNLVDRVMKSVEEIKRRFDASIIIVEQNVKYSLPVADRVVVLKTGGVIYEGAPEPLMDHQKLIELF
ncbi:ABC transporter ATP-binding protein [Aquamicrobium defluvii]|uniref:Amino acid/amide ABC transporter ATP-binding protein 2 (HAAT family) n=1 Tax=Aquamicrobium defluvii TaxID=69279 RepID=A0A011TDH8_9HYPH|nr:ABC transporter ATP-binding protein [Aquamicrobium defluvii]EXL01922.1 branched-chain amino acid ABC transporter ATP-binding protein [Aquamicrobium defluvii]EZQ12864.1 branched-chain amino acid ABC transporter ATP-binding protein [Halopseudomonas bauzanensis]TDR31925.1 amino acid/amide ABC transporter ATP-binding protein 2 (HAAT family) [Aquamicrobium defluvii]